MAKIDYKKEFKELYNAKPEAVIVKVPALNYLAIDGSGDPNTSIEFKQCVEALFALAYTIKFSIKKSQGIDFGVMPLEGLWWTTKMEDFSVLDKSSWLWTLLIMQPEIVTKEIFTTEDQNAFNKKKNDKILDIKFVTIKEGESAQIMHIGPYSAEAENIKKIHQLILGQGGKFDGLVQKHHEIYLGDMRKTKPEKLKTIIRQPFVR